MDRGPCQSCMINDRLWPISGWQPVSAARRRPCLGGSVRPWWSHISVETGGETGPGCHLLSSQDTVGVTLLLPRQIVRLRSAGVPGTVGVSVSGLRNNGTRICLADHLFTSN